jgi:tRNA modification GTPase
LQAEARIALAAAPTERTAAILLDQLRGTLRAAIEELLGCLANADPARAVGELRALQEHAELGRHLTAPWRVTLVGRPNVGKSSLVNAMLGFQRAIVYDQPGTTRDVLTATTAVDGWPIELADTAGLREQRDPLEVAGVASARRRLDNTDLVVLVSDLSQPWTAADQSLYEAWPRSVLVHNKADLANRAPRDRPTGILVSAVTGAGLEGLLNAISATLVPRPPAPHAPVPFNERQRELVQQANRTLEAGDPTAAERCLRQLLGG